MKCSPILTEENGDAIRLLTFMIELNEDRCGRTEHSHLAKSLRWAPLGPDLTGRGRVCAGPHSAPALHWPQGP